LRRPSPRRDAVHRCLYVLYSFVDTIGCCFVFAAF
jgi:hypothetical protein